eukprot:Hpha_TRINITY_DN21170_c0_g1::TRINITY_DN21170_c0_g1_i1::g.25260::m.25260
MDPRNVGGTAEQPNALLQENVLDFDATLVRACRMFGCSPASTDVLGWEEGGVTVRLEGQKAVSMASLSAISEALANHRGKVARVVLIDNFVGCEGVELICAGLRRRRTPNVLKELNLSGGDVRGQGLRALAAFLRADDGTEMLTLQWDRIGTANFGDWTTFCDAVAESRSLRVLDLRNNGLCAAHSTPLARAVRLSPGLKELDLRWNQLTSKTALDICDTLRNLERTTLEVIRMEGNGLDGAIHSQ